MTEEDEKDSDMLVALIQAQADRLGEHFDSVQIIATKIYSGNDDYVRFNAGNGNYYARLGSTDEWVRVQKQKAISND
jgi:hypothetical protein